MNFCQMFIGLVYLWLPNEAGLNLRPGSGLR